MPPAPCAGSDICSIADRGLTPPGYHMPPAQARVAYGRPAVEPCKGRNPGYGIKKKYEPRRGGIKGCIMS